MSQIFLEMSSIATTGGHATVPLANTTVQGGPRSGMCVPRSQGTAGSGICWKNLQDQSTVTLRAMFFIAKDVT